MLFLLCEVVYSLYAVLFSLYSRDIFLARFETRPTSQGSQNGSHHRQDIVARILKELSLGHFTELFHRENTPDIISMLSIHEMNQLGITSRVDMMNLR